MFITIKAKSQSEILSFLKTLKNYEEEYSRSSYVFMIIKFEENKITIYKNLTITIEGNKLNKRLETILIKTIMDNELYIGSDEVGVGEPIGPLITCGLSFKNLEQKKYFFLKGVIDSKKMNYKQIMILGKLLEQETIHKCISVNPENFNKQYYKGINVKLLNAVLHNNIHNELGNKISRQSVIDQFINEKKYYEYLSKTNSEIYQGKIIFETKGESKYLEIAAAAILAKYKFNLWVEEILSNANVSLEKYLKNSLNYRLIATDVNNQLIKIPPEIIVKSWKREK